MATKNEDGSVTETLPGERIAPKGERKHRASYASDKRSGGYNVRVVGPYPDRFLDRDVPVTRKDGTESVEHLTRILWSGLDNDTGEKVCLYAFEQKPREQTTAEF